MVWTSSMTCPFCLKFLVSIRDTPLGFRALCEILGGVRIMKRVSFCTWSLMILFPLRLAVVLTSVPSPVVSTKGTPNSNWMEVDLKVEEVSMPTVSPPRFLFVAVG